MTMHIDANGTPFIVGQKVLFPHRVRGTNGRHRLAKGPILKLIETGTPRGVVNEVIVGLSDDATSDDYTTGANAEILETDDVVVVPAWAHRD